MLVDQITYDAKKSVARTMVPETQNHNSNDGLEERNIRIEMGKNCNLKT